MEYFGIIDKNVAAIFQSQRKSGNISDMFLQYSVLCGIATWALVGALFTNQNSKLVSAYVSVIYLF